MKKRFWLLFGLVAVLLLGIASMAVYTEAASVTPKFSVYRLSLGDDISMIYDLAGLTVGHEYTVNFKDGDELVSTTTFTATSTVATVRCDGLTPADMTRQITVEIEGVEKTVTRSIQYYCNWVLSQMDHSNELFTLAVDLLNYGAASEAWLAEDSIDATNVLSDLQKQLASETPAITVTSGSVVGSVPEGATVTWKRVKPILGESIAYRFFFNCTEENVADLIFVVTIGDRTYTISGSKAAPSTEDVAKYQIDFSELDASNLREDLVIVATVEGDDGSVAKSATVTTSMERYAYAMENNGGSEILMDLLYAILAYSDSASAYLEAGNYFVSPNRDFSTGALTAHEQYRLANAPAENSSIPLYGNNLINAIYGKAGIDGSALIWKLANDPEGTLFPDGVLTTDTGSSLYKMLVSGSYGGTKIAAANEGWLPMEKYQIGDLLNWYDGETHYAGIYQGEGNFLVVNQDDDVTGVAKSYSEIKAEKDEYSWYYVLRPTEMVITRGDMEAAIKEVLWAYYAKDVWAQYESTTFNAISYTHGGYSPLGSHLNTLEDATSQNTLYSVCSNYAWCAYYEAVGYPLYGHYLNPGSAYVWMLADEVSADEEGDALCIMRWHNYPCDYFATEGVDNDYGDEDCNSTAIVHSSEVCCGYGEGSDFSLQTAFEEMRDFFWNYEENLRPGDIIRLPGHVVVYAGDGWILEAGGGKYDQTYGYDSVESDGVINATHILDYFFPNGYDDTEGSLKTSFRLAKFNEGAYHKSTITARNFAGICVLRPLDQMTLGHNSDPSNDILNLDYYNSGTVRQPWQLEQDTVELAHTGYTIQPASYTRLLYPSMNINRTVDVGAYGTAVKGGTITYTVQIINESNNVKYITTREGYTGETYENVPIVETIPANVEFVSASEGYYRDGNKLYWTIDVPAGESVSVTYTVKVTGDIGEEIVCGGGLVGSIPSNTIVNTIGGQNLSEEVQNALLDFYEAGKSAWNSNDGYKISASISQDGSVFAEQIYNAVGLELDLPELEDLLKMLFSREYIEISQGTFTGYKSSAASWMFTLNDTTTNAEDQIWRNMIINGSYFGGYYVWTNNLDEETRRVSIPRTDNLSPGDFIICMDISNISYDAYAYKIHDWKVIFYLGDDKYASLTSNGVLSACDGPRELVGSIVWDVFIGMRPSQAYENINNTLYTDTLADLTDADMAWQAIEPSTVVLNKSFMNTIAGFSDTTKVPYVNSLGEDDTRTFSVGVPMIGDVYALAGLDVNTNGLNDMTYKNLTYLLFNDLASESDAYATYGHEYHLLDQAVYGYESIYNMLMFYDGQAYVDKKALTSMDDLQVGDAIVLGRLSGSIQQVMIYQGKISGQYQFLMSTVSPIGGYYLGSWLETKTFADVDALLAYLNGYIVNSSGTVVRDGKYWEGYLVLRPARGFANINTRVVRDLTERLLTDEEKTVLSRLPATRLSDSNYNTFITWAYGQAMIDVGDRFAIKNGEGTIANNMYYYQVFDDSCVQNTADTDFVKMLVDKSWGGTKFANKKKESYQLPLEDYKVGDIFIGRYQSSGSQYRAAIYLGNNRFLMKFSNYARIVVYESEADLYGAHDWEYYFVLRPEELGPRSVTEKRLTEEEEAVLAALPADYSQIGGNQLSNLANWAYFSADIDISAYFTVNYNVSNVYWNLFSSDKLKANNSSVWYKMLVPGSYDGYEIDRAGEEGTDTAGVGTAVQLKIANYKIGDIFCGKTSSGAYWTALYQGEGKFLVLKSSGTAESMTFTDESPIADNTWRYYFVLRPDNLATSGIVIDKVQLPPIAA